MDARFHGVDTDDAHSHNAIDPSNLDWLERTIRHGTLLEALPVAAYTTDRAGVIQHFNGRAAEVWGREPALGETDERFCGSFRLFRPDGTVMPYSECPMAQVATGARPEVRDAELILERPDGSRVTMVVNARAQKDERGEPTGAIACFFDMTQRSLREETLRRSDRHKTEFLAMLAHELRNPLAPILVSLDLLRRAHNIDHTPSQTGGGSAASSAPPIEDVCRRVDYALTVMTRQVAQMVRLVDDLLDVARISQGKIEIRRERVEVSPVILSAVDAARPLCDRHGHELIVTLPSEPVVLNADPTRLAQIVGNLLNNACKFTPPGGHIWLTVTPSAASGPGRPSQVAICVRDTGIGIAGDQLANVFDLFTQGDTPPERSATGLGVGLTLVKRLAEMHGGSVEATSPGVSHGSEFTVRLPLAADDQNPDSRC